MEISQTNEQSGSKNLHKNRVHKVLAYSYLFHFLVFLVGLIMDYIFPLKIFEKQDLSFLGIALLFLGSILIFWAQISSRNLKKDIITKDSFFVGPYRYTRTPTNFGIFLVMLGFGLLNNALFIIFFAIFSFVLTKIIFLKKQEEILTLKYGTPYIEYKKIVKF